MSTYYHVNAFLKNKKWLFFSFFQLDYAVGADDNFVRIFTEKSQTTSVQTNDGPVYTIEVLNNSTLLVGSPNSFFECNLLNQTFRKLSLVEVRSVKMINSSHIAFSSDINLFIYPYPNITKVYKLSRPG